CKHGESAQAVAKKGRWSVQPVDHFRQQALDKSIQVTDGRFIDTRSAPRRLDRHHLHRVIEQSPPGPERSKAAARIGKTEQPGFGIRIGPRCDQPLSSGARPDLPGGEKERGMEIFRPGSIAPLAGGWRLFINSNIRISPWVIS